ncbi:bacteriophage antitermination protein Q [Salmonella enterica]|uniref:bacteriophage antitermination protein Q n=1 Tax=Salmonella enterica TaxID=28901 RepID=UPI003D31D0C2
MREQYLEYIRQQLTVALADFSGATKGQLQAWLENAQFVTGTFGRKRIRIKDEVTGKWYTLDNPPVPGKQSLAKGVSIALLLPVEFGTASWRRAVLSLPEHQKAWAMWIYGENTRFEYQTEVTRWAWGEFRKQPNKRRVAAKTMGRLKTLIWLAAQDVKAEMAGRVTYEYKFLAEMVGITPKSWSKSFTVHWCNMREIFYRLDREALLQASRARVEQKEGKFAKVD